LSINSRERWNDVSSSGGKETSPQERGETFFIWMEKESKAATSAKHMELACGLQGGGKNTRPEAG
jgi:hypothetical protein